MTEYQTQWWENTGRFSEYDTFGISSPIMRNCDTGEELPMRDLPPGSLYVNKLQKHTNPVDGLCVTCVIPFNDPKYAEKTTHWNIESYASNCDRREDKEHHCWVRHGTFRGVIHVDKQGNTCNAGAGSISVPGFHGFLHHGVLKDC